MENVGKYTNTIHGWYGFFRLIWQDKVPIDTGRCHPFLKGHFFGATVGSMEVHLFLLGARVFFFR